MGMPKGTTGLTEVWIASPNFSYRDPSGIDLLILHLTEGVQDIRSLGYFFQGDVGASSHGGADNRENFVFGAYVDENDKAWTQASYNSVCISLEQCAPKGASSGWSRDFWLHEQERLLRNSAYWLAHMSSKWNIPLVSLSASQAQGGSRGVCDHVDLGSGGSGHHDCGPGYPMDQVIAWAKEYQAGGGAIAEDFTSASTYWHDGGPYMTCIGNDGRPYYAGPDTKGQWQMLNKDWWAKSGADITAADDGRLLITFTNQDSHVCTAERQSGGGGWKLADRGGNAK
jgi:hypothetical protein